MTLWGPYGTISFCMDQGLVWSMDLQLCLPSGPCILLYGLCKKLRNFRCICYDPIIPFVTHFLTPSPFMTHFDHPYHNMAGRHILCDLVDHFQHSLWLSLVYLSTDNLHFLQFCTALLYRCGDRTWDFIACMYCMIGESPIINTENILGIIIDSLSDCWRLDQSGVLASRRTKKIGESRFGPGRSLISVPTNLASDFTTKQNTSCLAIMIIVEARRKMACTAQLHSYCSINP